MNETADFLFKDSTQDNGFQKIMNSEKIRQDWNSRGYSFGIFRDPPGQVGADFVHRTDELVVLAEGEIEVEIKGRARRPQIGEKVFIPARAKHTVRNVGTTSTSGIMGIRKDEVETI